MLAISQFYILSPRGDTIISRDYRSDIVKGSATAEIFFRKVKFWNDKNDRYAVAPAVFSVDGINFLHLRTNSLYFVVTTKFNVSPNSLLELLARLAQLCKDYCGVLSEEAIRKNFVLIYELLDEAIDYGYPQNTDTLYLKQFVRNEPVIIDSIKTVRKAANTSTNMGIKLPSFSVSNQATTTPSSAVHKPVTLGDKGGDKHRNEIFVDVIERLKLTFNSHGYVVNSDIDGCIQLKSYLTGNPALKLALNDDLVIGKGRSNGLAVTLDDCNFHDCVQLDEFDQTKTISFVPPDGEFILMNYRITTDFVPPFRVFPLVEQRTSDQVEMTLNIRADIPEENFATSVVVVVPVIRATNGVSLKTEGATDVTQTAEFSMKENQIVWTIKKFKGGTENSLRAKINFKEDSMIHNLKRELGPVSLAFEIPMYNVSNLQVKYLRIAEQQKAYNPFRWVRYLTSTSSYVCRI